MSTTQKNHVVRYLLTQMTYLLLARSPIKDAFYKAAQSQENRLQATLDEEELKPIKQMRDVISELVKKLADCQSVEQLQHTYEYIKALNLGEVAIAVEDPENGVVMYYERNR